MASIESVVARSPVNATAAKVTGKAGALFQYQCPKQVKVVHSDTPLPTREPTQEERGYAQWQNLTGAKFGRMTVIGQSATGNSRWVVRCACGRYTIRVTRSIKNKANDQDCCEICRHLQYQQKSQQYRRHGCDVDAAGRIIPPTVQGPPK